jgi:hypothetical protein
MLVGSFSPLVRAFGFVPNLAFAADTGGGAGGAGDPSGGEGGDPEGGDPNGNPPAVTDEKKYTEKDVEAMITGRLKTKSKELKKKLDENAELSSRVVELEHQISTFSAGDELDADAKKRLGSLELEKKRFETQINEQTKQIGDLQTKLDAEFNRRRGMERDSAIDSALSKIGCIDPKVGRVIFRDRLEYDEEEETWYYKMENGNTVDVDQGIAAECPDYLKPPNMRGGSGSAGGSPRKTATQKQLDAAKADLETTRQQIVAKPQDNGLLAKYRRLTAQIKQMESESARPK